VYFETRNSQSVFFGTNPELRTFEAASPKGDAVEESTTGDGHRIDPDRASADVAA
jgi:hypothetical protein